MQFFKTFVDVERLKLVGVLAQGPVTLQELTAHLQMPGSEVLRHLEQLLETGLVQATRGQAGADVFELQPQMLEEMAKRQFARARAQAPPIVDRRQIPHDFTEEERKVLLNYTLPNGEIKQIPLQPKKQQILIRY
ncbi:MAG: ArsR family transcriptional regulator, partial [Anaerolineales bacterium]|nr:ArsR family transcriptional regulator [Anaerolineales bacterium]